MSANLKHDLQRFIEELRRNGFSVQEGEPTSLEARQSPSSFANRSGSALATNPVLSEARAADRILRLPREEAASQQALGHAADLNRTAQSTLDYLAKWKTRSR